MRNQTAKLDLIILGASGNLARMKIFPALFALFSQGLLPPEARFYGLARRSLSQEEFREQIMRHLTCRYTPEHSCAVHIERFLAACRYCRGDYRSPDGFAELGSLLRPDRNRLFYLALPPEIFPAAAANAAGLAQNGTDGAWTRVVLEKPFGRDRASSDRLNRELLRQFSEEQLYRIDHYLGKEMVQNLIVLRFANQIFKPLWNSRYIRCVKIDWQENIGIEGRGDYFDHYGIIRDVIQNHLLQLVTLIAMREPATLTADAVRDRKLEVLRAMETVALGDLVLGQYAAAELNGRKIPGYTAEPGVRPDSLTPTFARLRLRIGNDDWREVPFIIRAGKALAEKKSEIRVVFRNPESNIFCTRDRCPPANELIIRIQPDEGIQFNIVSKTPGLKMRLQTKELDLSYDTAFADTVIPEAYESLLLDVINGEKALFIRKDELEAAWDIFTPVLHEIETAQIKPEPYAFGSSGPEAAREGICNNE
ncbi:MAG: glucose-6-phosphate dehydrogenase [Victivallaceae bacterium]|nr:glucose-6-phosphate dehydrogenase [Victivallaceae bacterium]